MTDARRATAACTAASPIDEPPRGRPARRSRLLLRVAASAGAAAALAAYAWKCAAGMDFGAFHDVARAALTRGDVYAPGATMGMYVFYPPHFSLLVMPLALLPRWAAGLLWFAAKAGGMVLLVGWIAAVIGRAAPALRGAARGAVVAVPLVLLLNPINGELKLGQVNLFVLFATVYMVTSLERGRPWRAAFAFSIALVKATPWVFVPWFVMRRQWGLLARMAVVGAGWVAALAAWYGPGRVISLFLAWLRVSRGVKMSLASMAYFENQSLVGVAARLATAFPALRRPVLGIPVHELLWMAAGAVLFAVLLEAVRRDRFRRALPATELAYVCVVMMLFGPDTRWAHQVQLLPPLVLLTAMAVRLGAIPFVGDAPAARSTDGGETERRRLRLLVRIVLGSGLVVLVLATRDLVGVRVDHALRDARVHFAYLALLATTLAAVALRRAWLPWRLERTAYDPPA